MSMYRDTTNWEHHSLTTFRVDRSNCIVCDLGQSVTHGLLSLSIFIELGNEDKDYPVIKELLFSAKKLGMELDFKIYDKDEEL